MNTEMKLTPRQLRTLLFQLDNQNMTVAELRNKLFNVYKQDELIPECDFMVWKKLGVEPTQK